MLKIILIINFFLISLITMSSDFYKFNFDTIEGKKLQFNTFKNKTVLIVNTASMCGFTKQYDGLQALHENYRDKGLIVLGIPSNSFMQEYGSEEKVKDFCETKFNITFPMTKIVDVIGSKKHPLYIWLSEKYGVKPKWNFHKVLIDNNGNFVDSFSSLTKPSSPKLINIIEEKIEG